MNARLFWLLHVGLLVLGGCATSPPVLPASSAALAPAPVEVCADVADCRQALRRALGEGDSTCEPRARAELAQRACEVGVAEGCTALAHLEGAASPRLRTLWRRACDGGDGEGCARLALTTLLGEGTSQDVEAGGEALRSACERFPAAACGLAVEGLAEAARQHGAEPEWEWLALFAQRGCDAGEGLSCRLQGDLFYAGRGVSADADKAAELYARACVGGDGKACANQALLLPAAQAPMASRVDALFTRGCDLGSPEACRLLVLETLGRHEEGPDGAVRQALFQHACEQGAGVGCLALYEQLKHQPPETRSSFQMSGLLKRACQWGEAQACEFLDEVSRLARPRCAEGSASACGALGVLLLSPPSHGIEAVEGLRLLHQACEAGDTGSCELLASQRLAPEERRTCRSR